jgi:RNA polymerase sigma factor (sigma-70 family)
MVSGTDTSTESARPKTCFVTTHWSVVLSAREQASPQSAQALETLCRAYWYPLYAFVRRGGHSPPDAEDLTQGFFAQLLEHNWIARAHRHKGRFRSFLLMAMKRFLANEWDKSQTIKRGGHIRLVPLPLDTAETRYSRETADTSTPEQLFEKQWALTLLESVLNQLREDYARDARAALFDALKPCLIGTRDAQPYAALAAKLSMTEGAVKVAVYRLRERYRERLKTQIAHTVATPSEVDAELQHLFRVLARH